jgi:hypothetical protein
MNELSALAKLILVIILAIAIFAKPVLPLSLAQPKEKKRSCWAEPLMNLTTLLRIKIMLNVMKI